MIPDWLRRWYRDHEARSRSLREAGTIVIGGVIAAAVFKFLIVVEVPELPLTVHLLGGLAGIVLILAIVFVLAVFLWALDEGTPREQVELTPEEREALVARLASELEDGTPPESED